MNPIKFDIASKIGESTYKSEIEMSSKENEINLIFKCNNILIHSKDIFAFFALVKIRLELEKMGGIILCNGARIDVYPSGMSVSGIMAYILKPGKPAKKMVNIFKPTKPKYIGSVEEQKKFRDRWFESLGI